MGGFYAYVGISLCAILLIASVSFAQSPQPVPAALTAEAMARVAANQDPS